MKNYLLILLVMGFCSAVSAQYSEPPRDPEVKSGGLDKSKLFIGGNFGLNFGNYTLVNVSPQLGYRFNDYFAAGAGVNFLYSSLKTEYSDGSEQKYNQGVAGLNIFG